MRPWSIGLGVLLMLGVAEAGRAVGASKPVVMDLWPGQAQPGDKDPIGEEKATTKGAEKTVVGLTNVSKPTISVYRPESGKSTGTAIVVCPGGGYNMLAWNHEGEMVADWLQSIGVTAVVLKYRVPRRPGHPRDEPPPQALMDAQRALSLVRGKAAEWGVDPKRIGMLGFSAGGHLTAWASTNFDQRAYETVDDADKQSCRPDFAVMIYPGGVVKRGSDQLAPEIKISSQTPPSFFAHAGNDNVTPLNSIQMYLALKRAGVPAELHIYATGGHGFGMRPSNLPCAAWPQRCEEWLKNQGFLKPAAGN